MKISIIAAGMGTRDTLTAEALRALEESDVIIGAARLLEQHANLPARALELTSPTAIRAAIDELESGEDATHPLSVGILVSGDVGFFSLAPRLREALSDHEVRMIPGVSSLPYFCAKVGIPWQDVYATSVHGRSLDVAGTVQSHAATFLLTGGATRAHDVCRELAKRGLGDLLVQVGERLSYPDERIVGGRASELARESFDDLAVILVCNPHPLSRPFAAPALADEDFERGAIPMTKRDVRALAIARLRLEPHHTLWDVGAGTGSVSVEGARAVPEGRVFAIERNPEAACLIAKNRTRFNATNLSIVEGTAPEALSGLPAPDAVFIGGSGGQLEAIFRAALEANPAARVVTAAITLETVAEAVRCLDTFRLTDIDISQITTAQARKAGASTLMMGANPVYLICGSGSGKPVDA